MNKSDLAPIRERLEILKQTSSSQTDVSEPLWDHPRSPELPITHAPTTPTRQTTQIADTVQALRQRSQQAHSESPTTEEPSPSPETLPPGIDLHWQRLQQEAIAINELAQKQAIAIQNFKRSADRLAWSLRKQPSAYGFEFEQFCEFQAAVVSQVTQDDQGKLVLTNVTVDLYQDERHASQTAEEIRAYSQARSQAESGRNGLVTFIGNPLAVFETCWQTLTSIIEARSQLTPLDLLIWLGGGLIGRLALELALSAVPGLWPWLVGATVGAVALALYRLLWAPRPDIAFVTRLFLALVGLAIGGHL
ncbi:MAG: hypothetical protein F6K42_04100 [Leptolyngbya sp. SIO1D8]|nr:hypothetical protein [Leptolyngbya sp. SIO1D8]